MRTLFESSTRSCVMKIVASVGAVLLCASVALAGPVRSIVARASGQVVVFPAVCSDTEFCQEVHASGTSTVLGRFDGVLLDRLNFSDGTFTGTFTGTGVFTTADGSMIRTAYTGLVTPPDPNGVSSFIEFHTVTEGTGRFDGSSGAMTVTGTVDIAGHVEIVGVGTLDK
jgi:hypothetical protein